MDTLSHVRRVKRFVRSQERKALKKQMDGYNSLARPARRGSHETEDSPDTIHDISERLQNVMSQHVYDRGTSTRARTRVDKTLQHIVCDEVRSVWHAKIGLASQLNDTTRAKLRESARNVYRDGESTEMCEIRLTRLARYFVEQWCENEGFNPDKIRPELLRRVKYNVEQRLF